MDQQNIIINENNIPKSINHKIIWNKNDNINTCDLNLNCTKIEFNIKDKNNNIFNNNKYNINQEYNIDTNNSLQVNELQVNNLIVDKLPIGYVPNYEKFISLNHIDNNDYFFVGFVFIILFVFFLEKK